MYICRTRDSGSLSTSRPPFSSPQYTALHGLDNCVEIVVAGSDAWVAPASDPIAFPITENFGRDHHHPHE